MNDRPTTTTGKLLAILLDVPASEQHRTARDFRIFLDGFMSGLEAEAENHRPAVLGVDVPPWLSGRKACRCGALLKPTELCPSCDMEPTR